jgi:hypothetical protein
MVIQLRAEGRKYSKNEYPEPKTSPTQLLREEVIFFRKIVPKNLPG